VEKLANVARHANVERPPTPPKSNMTALHVVVIASVLQMPANAMLIKGIQDP